MVVWLLSKKLARDNPNNARLICEYILTEQTEFNIKDSTKEGKIKSYHKKKKSATKFILNRG